MKLRVLIVDDHSSAGTGLSILIGTQADLQVAGLTHNAQCAVALALKLKPDIVLMDLRTLRTSDLQAAQRISRQSPKPKVLMLSEPIDEHSLPRAREAGVAGYLSKTTTPMHLLAAIRRVAHGQPSAAGQNARRVRSASTRSATEHPGESARGITTREAQVLKLIADGMLNKQIAVELKLSVKTVEKHRQALMDKLSIHGIALLTRYAISRGLISVPAALPSA